MGSDESIARIWKRDDWRALSSDVSLFLLIPAWGLSSEVVQTHIPVVHARLTNTPHSDLDESWTVWLLNVEGELEKKGRIAFASKKRTVAKVFF
jgi:hypothetical protein